MKTRLLTAFLFLFLAGSFLPARAQAHYEPITLTEAQTEIHVWTSGAGVTYARVKLTFRDGGYRVADWGELVRNGNDFSVDIKPEQSTEGAPQFILVLDHIYELGALPAGSYSFSVKSRGAAVKSEQFDPSQIVEHWQAVTLRASETLIYISTRGGVTFAGVELFPIDQPRRITDWGQVVRNGNDYSVDIKAEIWTGAPISLVNQKHLSQAYSLGPTPPGSYSFTVRSRGELVKTQPFNVNAGQPSPFPNPLEDPYFFVRQHYVDFLNREPDSGGLTYWAEQLIQCGSDAACMHQRRIGVSAAFFIEDEGRAMGGFVYRLYKGTLGRRPTYAEFNADLSKLVAGPNLEATKDALIQEWISRPEFLQRWPQTMSAEDFVRNLYEGAGLQNLAASQKDEAAAALKSGRESRAQVVKDMVELKEFKEMQYNPSFVLMQYFGYLKRDPDDGGYQFWLNVLDNRETNNYRGMVCSFITSAEYQQRFASLVTRTNQDCK